MAAYNMFITEKMIEREAQRIASMLGINKNGYYNNPNIKCQYDVKDDKLHLLAIHLDKFIDISFEKHDLLNTSLDDLTKLKIEPALKLILSGDLWYLNNDVT